MKKQLVFMAALLAFVFVLSGCSSDNKTVDKKTAEAIDISEYFPSIGMTREYIHYDTEGQTVESIETVNVSTDSEGNDSVYIHEKGGVTTETIKEYIVSSEEVKLVYLINTLGNNETAVVELANKPKWDKNDANKSVGMMTATGLTMEVPAGKYNEVIEITSVIPEDKEGKTIHYYAPESALLRPYSALKTQRTSFLTS
ncbi:hypothetical protein QNH10_18785 [Sporosarcina thermotolerans]|uniref:hypothetical protein n=1 Tax=Sporosarcina thermotolerans TaxID=633404 RepID=UPI0024BC84F9|nr:hypothetical protein [Sporosarcina thermotolerans]WHT48059.1 hypothetical protein QNH10_18785 [Sporosarcina thermotolerans]